MTYQGGRVPLERLIARYSATRTAAGLYPPAAPGGYQSMAGGRQGRVGGAASGGRVNGGRMFNGNGPVDQYSSDSEVMMNCNWTPGEHRSRAAVMGRGGYGGGYGGGGAVSYGSGATLDDRYYSLPQAYSDDYGDYNTQQLQQHPPIRYESLTMQAPHNQLQQFEHIGL